MLLDDLKGSAPAKIKAAFLNSFQHLGDNGAALSVIYNGEQLVSLFGGAASTDEAWTSETVVNVFSASKGALAIALHKRLYETNTSINITLGELLQDCSPYVAGTTLSDLLSHTSGLVAFHDEVSDGSLYNFDLMSTLARHESSWFERRSILAYSPFLWGWLVYGVLDALSDGEPIVEGVNYQLDKRYTSVAHLSACKVEHLCYRPSSLNRLMSASGSDMTRSAFLNPITQMVGSNGVSWRQSIVPAANGHTSAHQLAEAYSNFCSSPMSSLAGSELSSGKCATIGTQMRFSAGFMLPQKTQDTMFGTYSNGFGHSGAGGSFGFGDKFHNLSVAYVTNSMGQSLFMDQRGVMLTTEIFKYLGIDPYE